VIDTRLLWGNTSAPKAYFKTTKLNKSFPAHPPVSGGPQLAAGWVPIPFPKIIPRKQCPLLRLSVNYIPEEQNAKA